MASKVTHIKLSDPKKDTTEEIVKVKLSNGQVETVAEVVKWIDKNYKYYYTNVDGSEAEIESVHPAGRDPYIRTKANKTTKDNLLSLPKF
ncbi:DUF3892 domain-containing protein [Virgibacillus dokdonensis]|uniref:DUF3892 domain-containing protein n=1 Tax=Virgibacillus dokdonensis TaxID=302167 RepID=A0A2K9J2B2_9BACI|nr:DUF3892 domain-containing protein [Virgibacillus dokdonensis]AUJ23130.1 hypothetical protein A21D_00014 [Virgibacillus dokdonensis]